MKPLIIEGRPDFGNKNFGKTRLKRHPKYVYGTTGFAALVHKIHFVQLRWWEVGGKGEYLIRLDKPHATATTVCGQNFYLRDKMANVCAMPKSDAVLCGRCHGEGPVFGRNGKGTVTRREAHGRLGCVAEGE